MKMTVFTLPWGGHYLAIGVLACFMMAAVSALNTQDPLFAVGLATAAFVFYIGIFELHSIIKATTKTHIVVLGGAGLIVCFVVLMGVGDAVSTGRFSLLPSRPSWWLLPIGIVMWTLYELWRRRRPAQPIT